MLGWEVIPRIPLGDLSVSPHGVGIAVGYFIGATLMARRARRTGFDEDHAWNAAVVGILGAIVGARVAYVIGHSEQFSEPIEYLQIYKGGISLMGGLIGGFLSAWLYCRAKKLDFLRLADLGAVGLAIGTAVGRIGDLVIGDHLGRTTDGFWGWEYKGGELISSPPCDPAVYPSPSGCIEPGMVVHQTALYDSIWALVIFFVLLRLERKPRPKGFLVFTWAAMYSVGRILTDLTRVDKTWFGTGLTGSQLTAITVLALSVFFLLRQRKAPKMQAVTPGSKAGGAVAAPAGEEPVEPVEPVEAESDVPVEPVEPVEAESDVPVEPVEPVEAESDVPVEPVEPVEAESDVPVEPVEAEAPEAAAPRASGAHSTIGEPNVTEEELTEPAVTPSGTAPDTESVEPEAEVPEERQDP